MNDEQQKDNRIPDIDAINEARYESKMAYLEDKKEAKKLGMTIEEYYRERDEMHDDSWMEKAAQNDLW